MQVSELTEFIHAIRAPNVAPLVARLTEKARSSGRGSDLVISVFEP